MATAERRGHEAGGRRSRRPAPAARSAAALRAAVAALALALAGGAAAAPAAGAAKVQARSEAARERWYGRNAQRLRRDWGVDIVGVHPVSSGLMLRFDYRVVDPERAAVLKDRSVRPFLIDERTRTALAVPAMENVGELRQVAPLVPDRTYFMIFGNPGRLVKPGSRVTLVVGSLRAEGLVVD